MNSPPAITFSNEELAKMVNKNPILLSDLELRILLSLGSDSVALPGGSLVDVGSQSPRWTAWKVELDGRLMVRQIKFVKYSTVAAFVTAISALVTAVIALLHSFI